MSQWAQARADFWANVHEINPRIPLPTRHFIDSWFDLALAADGVEVLIASRAARDLIANRERKLKGSLARLASARALEMWNGAAGTGRMSYRWAQAQDILHDILRGLGKGPK